jgi:hypothetical protein
MNKISQLLVLLFSVLLLAGTAQAIVIDDFTEDTTHPDGWFCLSSLSPPEILTEVRLGASQHLIGGRCDIEFNVTAGNPSLDNPMVCYDKGGCDPDYGCWQANASYSSFFGDTADWVMEYGKEADLNANLTDCYAKSINIDFDGDMYAGGSGCSNPDPTYGCPRPVPVTITLISKKGTPQQATASKTVNLVNPGPVPATASFNFTDFSGIDFTDIDYINVQLEMDPVQTNAVDFLLYKIYTECTTAISLSSFTAQPGNGKVVLNWTTETEVDNAGFNIYSSESKDGEYTKINDELIAAQGYSTKGTAYAFIDSGLRNGRTYYYQLEDIDLNGISTMHGPVSTTPRWIFGLFGK